MRITNVWTTVAAFGLFSVTLTATDAFLNGQTGVQLILRRGTQIRRMFVHAPPKVIGSETRGAPEASPDDSDAAFSVDTFRGQTTVSRVFRNLVSHAPGIRQPPVASADAAHVPDQTPAIGVSIDGHSRAYLPGAMCTPGRHIVNDLVGGMPVTVTFCDRSERVRVLTQAGKNEPLDVAQEGLLNGALALRIDGRVFAQDSLDVPYEDLSFTWTTWGAWRTDHPDTEVYIGSFN
jgi:hypothetical protein